MPFEWINHIENIQPNPPGNETDMIPGGGFP